MLASHGTSPQAALAHGGAIQEVLMKRILLAAVACLSLLVALPAVSAAHSSGHHLGRHDRPEDRSGHRDRAGERHRNRNHAHRLEHFRAHRSGSADPSGSAGTVQTFQNGVLTIKLTDGATVSGLVTSDTRVSCEAMERDFSSHDRGSGSSGSGDHGDNGDRGGNGDRGDRGDNGDRGDRGDRGDHGDNGQNNDPICLAGLQKAGTTVRDAELSVSSAGAKWREIELEL
jgi:Ni/Co efflux regulator RcnB